MVLARSWPRNVNRRVRGAPRLEHSSTRGNNTKRLAGGNQGRVGHSPQVRMWGIGDGIRRRDVQLKRARQMLHSEVGVSSRTSRRFTCWSLIGRRQVWLVRSVRVKCWGDAFRRRGALKLGEGPSWFKLVGHLAWFYSETLDTIRDYQYNMVARGLHDNILVAFPIILGKTFIAATTLNWYTTLTNGSRCNKSSHFSSWV